MSNPVVTFILDAKDLASPHLKGLQRDLKGVETQSQRTDATMRRAGMIATTALAAGVAAVGYETIRYLGDSVTAYREEQVGVARLGASLKANIADWKGNTAAIEDAIASRMELSGFDDGALRDSLSRLVAATKNVSEAMDIQSVAMDLARFKGVDLATASDALIKVEGGQFRALKSLGIVLKDGATQTDALAAVQKVASGQMSDFMDSADGATGASLRLQNRLDNLQEEVGARISKPLADATEGLLGFMDSLGKVGEMMDDTNPALVGLQVNAQRTGLFWQLTGQQIAPVAAEMSADAIAAALSWDTGSERIGASLGTIVDAAADTKQGVYHEMSGVMGLTAQAIRDGASEVAQAWRAAMEQRNTEADNADQIIVNNAEIAVQKKITTDKKATAAEKAEARIRLRALKADNAELVKELELLKNKGFVLGQGFTLGFIRGLVADTDSVGESARTISKTVKQYLQVHSPSEKGPFSEMGGPGGWGERFGALWADGLAGSAGAAGAASDSWASGLAMPVGGPSGVGLGVSRPSGGASSPGGAGGVGAGGVTLVINSTWPPTPAQTRAFADAMEAELVLRKNRWTNTRAGVA